MKSGMETLQNSLRKINPENGWKKIGTNLIHETVIFGDCEIELGENNTIYPNTVIGFPGFIRTTAGAEGNVIIGDDNRIGCNVCIMIGAQGATILGNNNFVMNYVNVGHNVQIGNDNEIGVQSILAGWSKLGNENRLKIACNLRNRVTLGNRITVGMGSNVTKSFDGDDLLIYGNPAKVQDSSA